MEFDLSAAISSFSLKKLATDSRIYHILHKKDIETEQ